MLTTESRYARYAWANQRSPLNAFRSIVDVACHQPARRLAVDAPDLDTLSRLLPAELAPSGSNGVRRARCASRGIAGCGRLEGHGAGVTETASSETDCTRDSAPTRPRFGIARLSEVAQSGERDAVSRVPRGRRQRGGVVASPRRPRPAVPREKNATRDPVACRRWGWQIISLSCCRC